MAKFKYIGVPGVFEEGDLEGAPVHDSPRVTTVYGHRFVLDGPAVEVNDEFAIGKLRKNATFTEVKVGRPSKVEASGDAS